MGAWLFIDKDTVRSTCATKAEVLKFLLWVRSTPKQQAWARTANQTN